MTGVLTGIKKRIASLLSHEPLAWCYSLVIGFKEGSTYSYPIDTPYFDDAYKMFFFQGSYREMGRQFGEAFSLTPLLGYAKAYFSAHQFQLASRLTNAQQLLVRHHPEYMDWLNGIADVYPQYVLEDVVLAAFSTVLTNTQPTTSCSSIAFLRDGCPIFAQNLDLGRGCRVALACIKPTSGMAKIVRILDGYPWIIPILNEAGLVTGGSSVNVGGCLDVEGELLPQEIFGDMILSRARTVEGVLDLMKEMPPIGPLDGGINALFADLSGNVCNIELAGNKQEFGKPSGKAWITTNHFRSPSMANLNQVKGWQAESLMANSEARYLLAMRWFEEQAEPNKGMVMDMIREKNGEGAWLRTGKWPDLGYTTASYIVDLSCGEVIYWIGYGTRTARQALIDDIFHANRTVSNMGRA